MHFLRKTKKTKENHHENSTEASYQNTAEKERYPKAAPRKKSRDRNPSKGTPKTPKGDDAANAKFKHYNINHQTHDCVSNALHTRRVLTWRIPFAKVLRLPCNMRRNFRRLWLLSSVECKTCWHRRIQTLHQKNQQV